MTQTTDRTTPPLHQSFFTRHLLQGAVVALILILPFLLPSGDPQPDWPTLWRIKPLLVVPFSGALGGLFCQFMQHRRNAGGWKGAIAYLASLAGYMLVVWLGIMAGLNSTLWD